ncbi:MAG: amidase [Nocardiaceae bacterium]|nr:amidase [Nocardiaceae bacterium]
MSAVEIATNVRAGHVTAVDVVRASLDRIAELDGKLNAFQTVLADEAMADAKAVDANPDRANLPLAGVPVAVKDNIAVAGAPLRNGSAATDAAVRTADDLVVQRLREAGAVIVGTTRMPELAAWAFTSSTAFGVARNPLDERLDPGGSSGGSAVAVASGMAALALGTDGGGSIRVPSAFCGLTGLKPTRGRLPLPGNADEHWFGLTVSGPISSNATDAALAFSVLAADPGLATLPALGRLRISTSTHAVTPLAFPDSHQRRAVEIAGERFASAGHEVASQRPPYPMTLIQQWVRFWLAGIAQEVDDLGLDVSKLEPRTAEMAKQGRKILRKGGPTPSSDIWRDRALNWFGDIDVLVQPVTAKGPGPAGALNGVGYWKTYLASARSIAYPQPWNLAGFPAVTAIVGESNGLPLAVQLVGKPGSESMLLAAAHEIEQTKP